MQRPSAKPASPAGEQPGTAVRAKPRPPPSTSKSLALPYAAPGSGAAEPDLAYAAYDGGKYLTAFAEATRRVNDQGDPKAMTLLGELYANGFGVPKDVLKAIAWFSLAVDRGDREAMFELAMLRLAGRGGPRDRDTAAALLERAAKLGHVAAAYNLALLYLEGQQFDRLRANREGSLLSWLVQVFLQELGSSVCRWCV